MYPIQKPPMAKYVAISRTKLCPLELAKIWAPIWPDFRQA